MLIIIPFFARFLLLGIGSTMLTVNPLTIQLLRNLILFFLSFCDTDMCLPLWKGGLGRSWLDVSQRPLCGQHPGISSCAWREKELDTSTRATDKETWRTCLPLHLWGETYFLDMMSSMWYWIQFWLNLAPLSYLSYDSILNFKCQTFSHRFLRTYPVLSRYNQGQRIQERYIFLQIMFHDVGFDR